MLPTVRSFCILIFSALMGAIDCADDLRLGVLIPWTQSRPVGPFMASAISLGLETVQKHAGLLPYHNVTWIWNDSYCKGLRANEVLLDWWGKNKVDVVIGPACCIVCEEVADFLGAVNIPFISYGCNSHYLSRKPEFPTFSSVLSSTIEPVAAVFVHVAITFKWKNIVIVTTMESEHMRSISKIIREKLQDIDRLVRSYYIQTTVYGKEEVLDFVRLEKMKKIVTMTKTETTVVYLLMYNSDVINFLQLALKEDMCDGNYTFVTTEMAIVNPFLTSLPYPKADIEKSLSRLLSVEMRALTSDRWKKFAADVVLRFDEPPFKNEFQNLSVDQVHPLAGRLHDSILLWALAVNSTVKHRGNPRDGLAVTKRIQRILSKDHLLNKYSVSETDHKRSVIYGLSVLDSGQFIELFWYNTSQKNFIQLPDREELVRKIIAHPDLSKEFPECGQNNEFCPSEFLAKKSQSRSMFFTIFGTTIVVSALAGILLMFIRKQVMKWKISNADGWNIKWDDIDEGGDLIKEQLGCITERTYWPLSDNQKAEIRHLSISVGYYREKPVAIKQLNCNLPSVKDEATILELEQMLEMRHWNINEFYGICFDAPQVCVISQFAQKGSLWDLIRFKDFSLPMDFRMSFAIDIASGMKYLHQSPLRSHGHLKSTNCLVDSTWTCKVADFGLGYLNLAQDVQVVEPKLPKDSKHLSITSDISTSLPHSEIYRLNSLWMSPELLRMPPDERPLYGTQPGDVYSYGIILQELILKDSPFANELEQLPLEEIERRLRNTTGEILRPFVSAISSPNPVWNSIMMSCWAEDISSRPDFASVLRTWKQTNDWKQVLPVDKMLKLLQDHNEHLDNLVTQRKLQLAAEKKRLENLVERMLPKSIIEQLNTGKSVVPEEFSDVTIFISDIVEFTMLASSCEPEEVVALLSNLYSLFDDIMDKYDVYKVEIIGDAYVAASGVPRRNYRHALEIGKMALHILTSLSNFRMPTEPDKQIRIRIGVHSGPVVGGIIGKKMLHYCLFGDTLVTAGLLETNCTPMHVHISETTNDLLKNSDEKAESVYNSRLTLPAKGDIDTYYLVAMENFDVRFLSDADESVVEKKRSSIQLDSDHFLPNKGLRTHEPTTHIASSAADTTMSTAVPTSSDVSWNDDSQRPSEDPVDKACQQSQGKHKSSLRTLSPLPVFFNQGKRRKLSNN